MSLPAPTRDGASRPADTGRVLPWLVLATGLLMTAGLGLWTERSARLEQHSELERRAEALRQSLAARVQSYIDTLPGLRVFWVLNKSPSDAEFQRYVEAISLQKAYPGLVVTFVAEHLRRDQRQDFVAAVRGDRSVRAAGHPRFDINPPGDRPEYMVLRHLYPEDQPGFGYDLYDPGQRYREQVDAAVLGGGYVATPPVRLARDRFAAPRPENTSVVVRAAVYRGGQVPADEARRRLDVQGVAGIAFGTYELVRSVLPADWGDSVDLRIVDRAAQAASGHAEVFDSTRLGRAGAEHVSGRAVAWRGSLPVADRTWDIELRARPAEGLAGLNVATWLALALGSALSISLAVMTRTLVRSRQLAEERVQAATAALRAETVSLADSEHRFRMLFENSFDAVLRTRPDGTILAANPAACALFGYDEDTLRSGGRTMLVDMDDPRLPALLATREREGRVQGLCRMRRADGTLFEAELASSAYVDVDGQRAASLIARDVTGREVLAERQARLAAILDATPDFVGSATLDSRAIYLNASGRRLLGIEPDAGLGALTIAACHPPWAAQLVSDTGLPAALRDGVWAGQTAWLAHDGREVPVSQVILAHRGRDGRPTHLSTIARDLGDLQRAQAERAALESRLQQAQRMESIGTLAGGVAHDFNNVLAAILGNVALARDDLGADHPTQGRLDLIQRAATRARALVQQILTFSRRKPQERSVQPLQPLVDEALALLRATLPAGVDLRTCWSDVPLPVLADASQIQQVVMNLCTNAWQALPDSRGQIRVELDAVEVGADGAAPGAPAGHYARLRVSDDGQGMDDAVRARMFEPFFTTKPVGQGTGLGLAVVHGIVAAAGGWIEVDSQPGRGTCVDVMLALAEPVAVASVEIGAPRHAPLPPVAAALRVLYVDDDEVVAITVQSLLERAGYAVDCCASGDLALEQIRRHPQRYALVVTDFNMPGLSGLDLATALRGLLPALPVLITSGYVTDELLERAREVGVHAVLLKEYTLERLADLVARAVGRGIAAQQA